MGDGSLSIDPAAGLSLAPCEGFGLRYIPPLRGMWRARSPAPSGRAYDSALQIVWAPVAEPAVLTLVTVATAAGGVLWVIWVLSPPT